MAFSAEHLETELRRLLNGEPAGRFCVAFSGGIDSTALLHAMCAIAQRRPGIELRAAHVDHGIHPDSGRWAEHCRMVAARLDVPLRVLQVRVPSASPHGPEAAAREKRYAALEDEIAAGESLLTAQHLDDQAETVLLQLLRGAGPRGLSGMPAVRPFGCGRHLRPLLAFERRELLEYARQAGLDWLEDPANRDARFARSYLRSQVMPALRARWPSAAASLARAAAHQAEASGFIERSAEQALRNVSDGERLMVEPLRGLDAALLREVLSRWIRRRRMPVPSARKLETIVLQALHCAPDAQPCVTWPGADLRRYRGRLYLLPPLPAATIKARRWSIDEPLELPPGLGRLHATPATGAGIRLPDDERRLQVTWRHGGERIRPAGSAHHRPLKKLFQEKGIVPWMRSRVPLIHLDSGLVAVADLWIAHDSAAGPAENGYIVKWEDHPPLF